MKFRLVTLFIASAYACQLQVDPELITGCTFDSLAIVNPSSGFVITGENCGREVDKETFYEQPFVFYSEAVSFLRYTLIMVDKDNPLVADGNMYLHWISTDIDGESLKYGLGIYSGNTVAGNRFKLPTLYMLTSFHSSLRSARSLARFLHSPLLNLHLRTTIPPSAVPRASRVARILQPSRLPRLYQPG